jgi:large subunit ribosomal protein L15
MKLHDLRPAEGSHKARTRVGRGIAAGKGKTAGRGTKGQKARTGHGSLPAWFEGGQTPIHVRLPKLRGFKNRFRIEYEIVNVGRLSALAETGILDAPETDAAPSASPAPSASAKAAKAAKDAKPAPVTITPDILAVVGLVRTLDKPLKVLGHGDVTRPLFVVADAFSKSAIAKIEAAGGTAQVLEFPTADRGEYDETPAAEGPESPESPSAPSKKEKPPKPASTAETLPPTSSADEAGPEA